MSGLSRLAPVPLRLAAGAVFIYHGYGKTLADGGFQKFSDAVKDYGLPGGEFLTHLAAWGEFVGGILLVIGLATRFAALINAGTMFVAIWKEHLGADILKGIQENFSGQGGYEFPLVMLACCLSLVCSGAGAMSIDAYISPRRSPPPMS